MLGRRWTQRQTIKAVHEHDLEELLKSLGLYEKVLAGQATCYSCGNAISLDNLQAILPVGDRMVLCCSKALCLEQAMLTREKASNG